jgi:hypothetical protein
MQTDSTHKTSSFKYVDRLAFIREDWFWEKLIAITENVIKYFIF